MNRRLRITSLAVAALVLGGGRSAALAKPFALGIKVTRLSSGLGCQITNIGGGSVAERMQLQVGDVIIMANGRRVMDEKAIHRALATERIVIIIQRDGEHYTASAGLCVSCPEGEPEQQFTQIVPVHKSTPDGIPLDPVPAPLGEPEMSQGWTPPPPVERRLRFGVWGRDYQFHNGVKAAQITRVEPDSASQHLRQVDDTSGKSFRIIPNNNYILEVNGAAISTYAELQQAIAASPPTCIVRVFNGVTGKDAHYTATLR